MNTTKNKPAKRKLNVKLLRRVKRHILAEPRRLVMKQLVVTRAGEEESFYGDTGPQKFAPCGTAACIAGWTLILSGRTPFKRVGRCGNDADTAARLLGIKQYVTLFYYWAWPRKFSFAYRSAENARKRAKIAADRIEHLITTGE